MKTRSPLFLCLAVPLLLSLPTAAETYPYESRTGETMRRPNEDLTMILPGDPVGFSSLAVFVDQSGSYTIDSSQDFDGFLVLYEDRFDPARPLDGAVAANDDAGGGPGSSTLTLRLAAGVVYTIVTTGSRSGEGGDFFNSISGPGRIRDVGCFIGDEPFAEDDVPLDIQSFRDNRFCVSVGWRDFNDRIGFARVAGKRTEESGLFWFFGPENWEVMVKVLDGCAINGHYWVFVSAMTNVEFEVLVSDVRFFLPQRRYTNALGAAPTTTTDTTAFPCAFE